MRRRACLSSFGLPGFFITYRCRRFYNSRKETKNEPMRLYLIRHADPDYPNKTITERGHKEAQALAARLARENLDRVYSSPLGRAIHTMQYTTEITHHEPVIEDWTQELAIPSVHMDEWGKHAIWDLPGEIIRGPEHEAVGYGAWEGLPFVDQTPIRERVDELKIASDAFFARHGYVRDSGRYRCIAPSGKRIAVFCHGGFGLAWLSHLLEIPLPLLWSGFWLPPSSVTTIFFEQRSNEWAVPRCVGLGDVSHLYAAGLEISPRGILGTNW